MKMLTLTIDGKPYSVDAEGKNLLAICLSLGFNLPYFCWHPAMHSVGACRQCAVKLFRDEKDTQGRIVMSCMTAAVDGMRISIEDLEAREFRSGVIEWLMVNHPHDCPICDEGGECHLQDMTVMSGHVYRRYRFTKRTHKNQDLGPFLNHEMNRCIQCYRCVRFYRDYAGGRDFEVQGWHDSVYFGRHSDGTLENEFSGNLAEVCPTGVFTDKTLKNHYSRKWDLATAPSVCVHCGVGCNTSPGERYGMIRRIRPRYNGKVNGYFLCDRGRYGYEFLHSERIIRRTLLRRGGTLIPVDRELAFKAAQEALSGTAAIGIGSPRASLETNYALRRLVGAESFFMGVPDGQLELTRLMARILAEGPVAGASVKDAADADATVVLGEDVWNTAPILALNIRQASRNAPISSAMKRKGIQRWDDAALRQAIQRENGPLFIATVESTGLDVSAQAVFRGSPDEIARLGFAIAHEIDSAAPEVPGLTVEAKSLAGRAAAALLAAERPVVASGSSLGSAGVIQAAANIAWALKKKGRSPALSFSFPEANSFGAALMSAGGIESAAKALREKKAGALLIVETDIVRQVGSKAARELFSAASHVLVIDCISNGTTEAAEIVLPAAPFSQSSGTLVSSEGRAQRFFAVHPSAAPAQESWRWLGELSAAAGRSPRAWQSLDEVVLDMCAELPALSGARKAASSAAFRINGAQVPRDPHRVSGRTAKYANIDVHEPKPPEDRDSPLAYSMEGFIEAPPPSLVPRFWAPGWNSDQAINKFQIEAGGPLRGGDPGVRLVEPREGAEGRYFTSIPHAFAPVDGQILLVAHHHVFGSEELSALASAIASRCARPYLAIGEADARRLGLEEGRHARLILGGDSYELPVAIRGLPSGVAALPAGVPGLTGIGLPAWASLEPAGQGGAR
jgi:NADH-quinone oxidoreductase subunit G